MRCNKWNRWVIVRKQYEQVVVWYLIRLKKSGLQHSPKKIRSVSILGGYYAQFYMCLLKSGLEHPQGCALRIYIYIHIYTYIYIYIYVNIMYIHWNFGEKMRQTHAKSTPSKPFIEGPMIWPWGFPEITWPPSPTWWWVHPTNRWEVGYVVTPDIK